MNLKKELLWGLWVAPGDYTGITVPQKAERLPTLRQSVAGVWGLRVQGLGDCYFFNGPYV